jgi:hypothetical protein
MKTLLAVIFLSLASFAQTTINSQGGTIVANPDSTLAVVNSPVTLENGSAADGFVSFNTGQFVAGGNLTTLASYNAGGSFIVSVAGQSIFNGTIDSGATWLNVLKQRVSTFTLTGTVTSLDGTHTGSFVLTTPAIAFNHFSATGAGSSSVASINVTLN